jgi:hypothetical protein
MEMTILNKLFGKKPDTVVVPPGHKVVTPWARSTQPRQDRPAVEKML